MLCCYLSRIITRTPCSVSTVPRFANTSMGYLSKLTPSSKTSALRLSLTNQQRSTRPIQQQPRKQQQQKKKNKEVSYRAKKWVSIWLGNMNSPKELSNYARMENNLLDESSSIDEYVNAMENADYDTCQFAVDFSLPRFAEEEDSLFQTHSLEDNNDESIEGRHKDLPGSSKYMELAKSAASQHDNPRIKIDNRYNSVIALFHYRYNLSDTCETPVGPSDAIFYLGSFPFSSHLPSVTEAADLAICHRDYNRGWISIWCANFSNETALNDYPRIESFDSKEDTQHRFCYPPSDQLSPFLHQFNIRFYDRINLKGCHSDQDGLPTTVAGRIASLHQADLLSLVQAVTENHPNSRIRSSSAEFNSIIAFWGYKYQPNIETQTTLQSTLSSVSSKPQTISDQLSAEGARATRSDLTDNEPVILSLSSSTEDVQFLGSFLYWDD